MNHIIVEMPINALTEQWALDNYPQLTIKKYSNKRNKYLLLSRSLLQYILTTSFGITKLPEINYQEHGKPYFINKPDISFNITHTDESMAIIVSEPSPVGIDLETIKSRKNFDGLENKVLHSIEKIWLNKQDNYLNAFFTLWSAKEAYLKATGLGLSGLSSLVLDLDNRIAFGPLEHGCLYIKNNTIKESFVCYLPNKATPNLYQFNGNNLIYTENKWQEINCMTH